MSITQGEPLNSEPTSTPSTAQTAPPLVYACIWMSAEKVCETDGRYVAVEIPRHEVQSIKLRHGSGAEHPVLQLTFGGILLAIGVAGLIAMCGGNFGAIRYEIPMLFFGLVGLWMVWEAARKRTYLLITTTSTRRKLFFDRTANLQSIREFLQSARETFGYQITLPD